MKTKNLVTLSVIALGTVFAASAQAGWSVGVSMGGPVYRPAHVVVSHPPVCAPPVVVCPPPRVVCYPPRPVYVPPCHIWGRYDYDRYDRHGRHHGDRDYRRNDHRDNRSGWHR